MKNTNMLYDNILVISDLNRVPNFDPRRFIKRRISPLTKQPVYDLDLNYKKLWLRLKYPQARVNPINLKITSQIAIVEARVFFHLNDTESISRYTATTSREKDGPDYVKLAQYIACDQALSDAGFGCQFADVRGEFVPSIQSVSVSGNRTEMTTSNNTAPISDNGNLSEITNKDKTISIENNVTQQLSSGQPGGKQEIPKDRDNLKENEIVESEITCSLDETQQEPDETEINNTKTGDTDIQSESVEESAILETQKSSLKEETSVSRFTNEMPVDEILATMTLEEAEAVMVDFGMCNGKTLGQIAKERPVNLKFYRHGYTGDNNVLIAGATLILERCFEDKAA